MKEHGLHRVNSSAPSAAYMHQWIGSALVQIMACRLLGAKPLFQSVLAYCQLDSREQISVKFESEFFHFHSRICIWNCRLPKWQPFCRRGNELSNGNMPGNSLPSTIILPSITWNNVDLWSIAPLGRYSMNINKNILTVIMTLHFIMSDAKLEVMDYFAQFLSC